MSKRTSSVSELIEEEKVAVPASPRRSTRIASSQKNNTTSETTPGRITRSKRLSTCCQDDNSMSSTASSPPRRTVTRSASKSPTSFASLPMRRTRRSASASSIFEDKTRVSSPMPKTSITKTGSSVPEAPVTPSKIRTRKSSVSEKAPVLEAIEEIESKVECTTANEKADDKLKTNNKNEITKKKIVTENTLDTIEESDGNDENASSNIKDLENQEPSRRCSTKSPIRTSRLSLNLTSKEPMPANGDNADEITTPVEENTEKQNGRNNEKADELLMDIEMEEETSIHLKPESDKNKSQTDGNNETEAADSELDKTKMNAFVSLTKLDISGSSDASDKENQHATIQLTKSDQSFENKTPTKHEITSDGKAASEKIVRKARLSESNIQNVFKEKTPVTDTSYCEPMEVDYFSFTEISTEQLKQNVSSNEQKEEPKRSSSLFASLTPDQDKLSPTKKLVQLSSQSEDDQGKEVTTPKSSTKIIQDQKAKTPTAVANKSINEDENNKVASSEQNLSLSNIKGTSKSPSVLRKSVSLDNLVAEDKSVGNKSLLADKEESNLIITPSKLKKTQATPTNKLEASSPVTKSPLNTSKTKDSQEVEKKNFKSPLVDDKKKPNKNEVNQQKSKNKKPQLNNDDSGKESDSSGDEDSLSFSKDSESDEKSDLDTKIDKLMKKVAYDTSEGSSDESVTHFLDEMAEEGEEDTPSEGSNDIIDDGESVGSTVSEIDSNDSYEVDSFINDDEDQDELLPGTEYDLADKSKDDEVEVEAAAEPKDGKRNWKRIQLGDLSDSEDQVEESEVDKMSTQAFCGVTPSILSTQDSLSDNEKTTVTRTDEIIVINEMDNLQSLEEIKQTTTVHENIEDSSESKNISITLKSPHGSFKMPIIDTPNNSITEKKSPGSNQVGRKRLSSLNIQENISLKEIEERNVKDRVANMITAFCAGIKEEDYDGSGNISLNISLDYSASPTKLDELEKSPDKSINRESVVKPSESPAKENEQQPDPEPKLSKRQRKKRKNIQNESRTEDEFQKNKQDDADANELLVTPIEIEETQVTNKTSQLSESKKKRKKKTGSKLEELKDVSAVNDAFPQETEPVEIPQLSKKSKKKMKKDKKSNSLEEMAVMDDLNIPYKKLKKSESDETSAIETLSDEVFETSENIQHKPSPSAIKRKKKRKHTENLPCATTKIDYLSTDTIKQLVKSEKDKSKTNKKDKDEPKLLPSTSMQNSEWKTDIINTPLKPTTSKKRRIDDSAKFHVKDFKNKMLYNPARVQRIDSKALLKKKEKM